VISAGVLGDDSFNVSTDTWASSDKLPASALTAKVLCKSHNERLSALDAEATKLSSGLRNLWRSQTSATIDLDAAIYERWTIKVLANLCAARWAASGQGPASPPAEFVTMIFRGRPAPGCNLYVILNEEQDSRVTYSHEWNLLTHEQTRTIWGVMLGILGFSTMTILPPTNDATEDLRKLRANNLDLGKAHIFRNPAKLDYRLQDDAATLSINFHYP
jgi:hypothetical protein